jgi:hypothetical protein
VPYKGAAAGSAVWLISQPPTDETVSLVATVPFKSQKVVESAFWKLHAIAE